MTLVTFNGGKSSPWGVSSRQWGRAFVEDWGQSHTESKGSELPERSGACEEVCLQWESRSESPTQQEGEERGLILVPQGR